MTEYASALLILIGAFFVLVGSIGLVRFPDFYTRLHAPTKATTLGLAALLTAYIVHGSGQPEGVGVREFLITLFLFITAPVSAHMLARAAIRRRVKSRVPPPRPLDEDAGE